MRHSLVKWFAENSYQQLLEGEANPLTTDLGNLLLNSREENTFLIHSEWDEVSKNLIQKILDKDVKNPKPIYLVSTYEFPELFGLHKEVNVPCLVTTLPDRSPMVEDYPPRIWYHLGLC